MHNWKKIYNEIHNKAYNISVVKQLPSEWVEENIILPDGVSRYKGPFSYDISPYCREVINMLSSDNPARNIAIMKSAQIGFTQGVIIPGMVYTISEDSAPMLFMAANKDLAKRSVEERLDPVLDSSGLMHLIKPNVIRGKNQRTGNTSLSKEYAGGRLNVDGSDNAKALRQFSVKIIWADDFDAAPKNDKKEGSIRKTFEARQNSYGNMAKTFFISTPTVKDISNIEEAYLMGDQRKWNWLCPHCDEYFVLEWRTPLEDGRFAGICFETDNNNRLINNSVHYKCPHCFGEIRENSKYDMNLKGKWIATAEPVEENFISYSINNLACPPGFITWVDLVKSWLLACPIGKSVNVGLLKAFYMTQLGLPWEEKGETLRVNELMKNTRNYSVGIVPDETSVDDGNGDITLLTLAIDLGGIMNREINDVRADWEIKAHSKGGQSYSVEHGSIGTFKRKGQQSKKEYAQEINREKWTYDFNVKNSVWLEVEKLMRRDWYCESGKKMKVGLTVIDTGHFTQLAYKFIESVKDELTVMGIKGDKEPNFRALNKDTAIVSKSNKTRNLYFIYVNQVKDIIAENMKLKEGDQGEQPEGFMNFPMPSDGLYTMKSYFSHFESERRTEEIKNNEVVGFKWEKVNENNHFWDVHIYNYSAKFIFMDMLRRSDPKFKDLEWLDYCEMVS